MSGSTVCGIIGLFSESGIGKYRGALQVAHDIIRYRGPDGGGIVLFDTSSPTWRPLLRTEILPEARDISQVTLALGHRRLAIIDLSPLGLQPMSNKSESLWITYNGEIYNYLELRTELEKAGYTFRSQSDTEVILYAYEEWGEDCVNHFNGMWAFAIADLTTQRLFCSRDRFGIKPFYYYYDGQHFVFASEIKQIICFPFVRRQMNERAVYEFLAYSAVDYCEETFFSGIYKISQGYNLIFDLRNKSLKTHRYYNPHLEIRSNITLQEAAHEFHRLLKDSVCLQLRSDVEVGSCLSGGLDSSSIVCLIYQLLNTQNRNNIQNTFSSHFEEQEANEYEYMQEVINFTGVQAHFVYPTPDNLLHEMELLVWHQEEPFGSTSIFAQWSVYKLVHAHGIKVMLDGQGADEQLAGYIGLAHYFFTELQAKQQRFALVWEKWRHLRLHRQPCLPHIPGRAGDFLRRLFGPPPPSTPALSTDWIKPEMTERYSGQSYYAANWQIKPFGELDHLNNILYQLTFLNNLQALLRYEDRNAMAFSVESRVPFLDHRLVEFIFCLPSHLKIRNGYTKRPLRDGMAEVIPEKIRWRVGKLGFTTPERTWQRTILRPLIEQAIRDESLSAFLLPDRALAYLGQIEQHDILDFAPWRWVNLSLWRKIYELA